MASNTSLDYITFVKKNITKYMKLMMDKDFVKDAFTELLDTYIKVRYYNYYDVKYKNFESNINFYVKNKAMELIKDRDEKNVDKIKAMFHFFKYILYFDDVLDDESLKDITLEIYEYRCNTLGLSDDITSELTGMINEDKKRKEKYLGGFDSDKFYLKYFKTNNKYVLEVQLDYNIKFNRIYSDYSIDKVYNTGIINEDKLFITYYLVSNMILKNAIKGEFNINYMVSFPCSLFEKKDKLNRLLNIINSEVIRNNIVIKFSYSDYLLYKDIIDNLIKEGYKVGIIIDDKFTYDDHDIMWLSVFSYVIVQKDTKINGVNEDKMIVIRKQVKYGYVFQIFI